MDDTLLHLRQRFNIVMALLLGLALLASVWLVWHYYDVLHNNVLETQKSEAKRLRSNVDGVLSAMARHVTRLQLVADDALADLQQQTQHEPPVALQAFYVNDQLAGYSLDALHRDAPNHKIGNIATDKKNLSDSEKDEITVMWRLFPLMRAMHASEPALLWSYYQSLRFIALNTYPFEAASTEVERNGYSTFHDFITGFTTPQRIAHIYAQFANTNVPEWRGAHIDGGGGGWIASVTAPVRHKNELWAVVAADVSLQFLTDNLQANVSPQLRAIILDDQEQLLADSAGLQTRSDAPKLDADTFGLIKQRVADGQWQTINGRYVLTQTLDAAPWQLVIISSATLSANAEWTSLTILALVSCVFIVGLILLSMWLRQHYVAPALRLAQQVLNDQRADEQPYPEAWRSSARKLNEMHRERELLLTALQREQQELETRVAIRTQALTLLNKEMESFSYAVSHDLRGPLRAVNGFAQALREDYEAQLPEDAKHYIERICTSVARMEELIEGLLQLSRAGSGELQYQPVDLSALSASILQQLQEQEPQRVAEIDIAPNINVVGDSRLLRAVMENLIGNAWKYSSAKAKTVIQIGCEKTEKETVYFITDQGAGFDMQYADRLFVPFQRLHSSAQFSGTGVGLATVQRIINRHGGRIWAKAEPDVGATFYFTLS